MDIEQKTDLTYVKIEEIDKKINKMIDDISDLSPFSDDSNNTAKIASISSNVVTIMGQNVNVKTDTEKLLTDTSTLINDSNSIKTNTEILIDDTSTLKNDTDTLKIDVSTIKTTMKTISDNLESGFDLSEINTSLNTKTEEIITNINTTKNEICDSIKGVDNIDITQINDKLTDISNFLTNTLDVGEFIDDPFKLNADFEGYTKKAHIYNTTDSIECTKSYTINILGNNANCYLLQVGIYCEDDTFDINFTCDIDIVSENAQIVYDFTDATIGDTNKTYLTENLTLGRNTFSKTIENINVLESGNFVYIRLPNAESSIVHSFKLEVFGSNISILTKPKKFKVFCKHDETIISKVEDYNGYYIACKTDDLNANTINLKYTLDQENVRDYMRSISSLKNYSATTKGVDMKTYVELDGHLFQKISIAPEFIFDNYRGELIDCIDYPGNRCHAILGCISNYSGLTFTRASCYLHKVNSSTSLGASTKVAANFTFVKSNYEVELRDNDRVFSLIMTKKNGENILFDEYSSTALQINLGFGENVTAYYDKDNSNIIYVYMKVKDKMVRKTVVKSEIIDEENVTTNTFEITEQKVIGTYDIYYETPSNKYFVVKNNQLYIFKQS